MNTFPLRSNRWEVQNQKSSFSGHNNKVSYFLLPPHRTSTIAGALIPAAIMKSELLRMTPDIPAYLSCSSARSGRHRNKAPSFCINVRTPVNTVRHSFTLSHIYGHFSAPSAHSERQLRGRLWTNNIFIKTSPCKICRPMASYINAVPTKKERKKKPVSGVACVCVITADLSVQRYRSDPRRLWKLLARGVNKRVFSQTCKTE